jgi:hypothetical protein
MGRAVLDFFQAESRMKESATCRVFYQVMAERKQALCLYDGYRREFYPIVLGHTMAKRKSLAISSTAAERKPSQRIESA